MIQSSDEESQNFFNPINQEFHFNIVCFSFFVLSFLFILHLPLYSVSTIAIDLCTTNNITSALISYFIFLVALTACSAFSIVILSFGTTFCNPQGMPTQRWKPLSNIASYFLIAMCYFYAASISIIYVIRQYQGYNDPDYLPIISTISLILTSTTLHFPPSGIDNNSSSLGFIPMTHENARGVNGVFVRDIRNDDGETVYSPGLVDLDTTLIHWMIHIVSFLFAQITMWIFLFSFSTSTSSTSSSSSNSLSSSSSSNGWSGTHPNILVPLLCAVLSLVLGVTDLFPTVIFQQKKDTPTYKQVRFIVLALHIYFLSAGLLLAVFQNNYGKTPNDFVINHPSEIYFQNLTRGYDDHSSITANHSWDFFFSHEWGTDQKVHKFVKQLGTQLESRGVKVWLDEWEVHVGDQLFNKLIDGISHSTISLMFLSAGYCKKVNSGNPNDNCKKEFDFMIEKKNDQAIETILVILEEEFRVTKYRGDYLNFALPGDPMYFDLVEEYKQFQISNSPISNFKIDSFVNRVPVIHTDRDNPNPTTK